MSTCYIIDDDQNTIDQISNCVSLTPDLQLLGATTNPIHGVNVITQQVIKPDFVFLDIEMPDLPGNQVAPLLIPYTEVIYTTGHDEYAVQAFNLNMADFLHKPFDYPRFLMAVNKVLAKIKTKNSSHIPIVQNDGNIVLKIGGKLVKIFQHDIIMVESEKHKTNVYLENQIFTTYISISEMVEVLDKVGFLRINKSYIVNLNQIIRIEKNVVVLKSAYCAIIGPTYREQFFERLKKLGLSL